MKIVQQKIVTVDGYVGVKSYIMLEKLGEGSYSQCMKVQVSGSEQFYAMKIIPKAKLKQSQHERLLEEIRIHQSLSHQHIVFLDHWFQDSVNHYILLEYCPNQTLETRCVKFTTMDEKHVRRYSSQVLSALKYLHGQKVLHRDADDEVKLGDFGLACRLQSSTDLKREPCGTPDFAAPELIGGFGYSFPADVWSFGVILYRMKFGHCPFDKIKVEDTLRKIKSADYTFLPWEWISPQLSDLISRILVIDYDARLTLNQIQQHPFFKTPIPRINSLRSLVTRFFKRDSKEKERRRIDSCESRKNIKKILKEKTETTTILMQQKKAEVIEDQFDASTKIYLDNNRTFSKSAKKLQLTKLKEGLPPKPCQGLKSESTAIGSKESNQPQTQITRQLPKLYLLDQSEVIVVPMPPTIPKPQKQFQTPSNRIARLTNKFKCESQTDTIMSYYSSYLVYSLQEQADYYIIYLTNGLRQIIHLSQLYFVVEPGLYLNSSGQQIESPPKFLDYICKQKLKDPKFKLTEQAIRVIIQKGNFVEKLKKLECGKLLISLSEGTVLTVPNSKMFYLKTETNDYLYNDKLEMVSSEDEKAKCRKIYEQSAKNRDKSTSKPRKMLE